MSESAERAAASGAADPLVSETPAPVESGAVRVPATVVLVGHGSHRSSDSARPIHELARRLRRTAAFEEVRVAFWKEEPSLRHAFDLVEGREVFVVPVFTSEGYFTDRVVPREMGIDGPVTHRDGKRIQYLPPVGTHPRMAEVVLERAREAASLSAESASDATLVVVGHGTNRHPRSAEATLAVVERLRDTAPYDEVHAAFLDQDPELGDLLSRLTASDVIVVPFFISEGWHTGTTIPRDLALEGGRTQRGDTTIWYSLPVGTHGSMTGVVQDIVSETVAASEAAEPVSGTSEPPARRARREFQEWVEEKADARTFLQAQVSRTADARFEVRHVADADRPAAELSTLRDPEDASGVAALTDDGRHRPLRTAPDLRAGWRFEGLSSEETWEVIAHLYPAAAVHWHLWQCNALHTTPFLETARRQSGMYEGVDALPATEVDRLVEACCSPARCLRQPVWNEGGTAGPDDVPCPEPCSLFISMARETLDS